VCKGYFVRNRHACSLHRDKYYHEDGRSPNTVDLNIKHFIKDSPPAAKNLYRSVSDSVSVLIKREIENKI
jgi:hypothetical protein